MLFLQGILVFLGRVAISAPFIYAGVHQIMAWKRTEEILVTALCDWQVHARDLIFAEPLVNFLLQWVPILLALTIGLQLLGGFFVLTGYRARLGALFLLLFLLPVNCIAHPFWLLPEPLRGVEELAFIKNCAIAGGLLIVLAYGHGLPRRRPSESAH